MRVGQALLKTGRKRTMRPPTKVIPRIAFRGILKRSGMSTSAVARLAKYASSAGLNKYMLDPWGEKPIPYDVVKKVIPIIRGRGDPPITAEELLAVSDVKDIPKPVAEAFVALVDDIDGLLVVQYRIEPGVYVRLDQPRSLGASRIGVSKEYPAHEQFVCALATEIKGLGKPNSQLHCVKPEQFSPSALSGRVVVISVPLTDKVAELVVGKVQRVQEDRVYLQNWDGDPIDGTVIGVVVAVYKRL